MVALTHAADFCAAYCGLGGSYLSAYVYTFGKSSGYPSNPHWASVCSLLCCCLQGLCALKRQFLGGLCAKTDLSIYLGARERMPIGEKLWAEQGCA